MKTSILKVIVMIEDFSTSVIQVANQTESIESHWIKKEFARETIKRPSVMPKVMLPPACFTFRKADELCWVSTKIPHRVPIPIFKRIKYDEDKKNV